MTLSIESQSVSSVVVHRELMRSTGYAHGFAQPSLMYRVRRVDGGVVARPELARLCLEDAVGTVGEESMALGAGNHPLIGFLLVATHALLSAHHHPVFSQPKVWSNDTTDEVREWAIAQPCLDFDACRAAIDFAAHVLALSAVPAETSAIRAAARKAYEHLSRRMRSGGAAGFNTLHFLRAAHRLGIPWTRIDGNVFQLGQGRHLRWLDSSFTDRTPHLSVVLAQNKVRAAHVMRGAGVPVPAHELARSAEHAEQIAQRLGYPVVVKPADRDGGVGVSAFLTEPAAVRAAYALAASHSKKILVEKHVFGQDYRVQVMDGQVQGVIHRTPGSVVGDGVRTVLELIEQQNLQRATATDDRRYLHPIQPDEEAHTMLRQVNLSMDSVVPKGQRVRLRSAANVASGGAPMQLSLEDVHRDNQHLAVRAAACLGLDVAGVDLLIPDIGVSWLTIGASICEVNAQPQMFTTFHEPALKKMFAGDVARIPVLLVLSRHKDARLTRDLHRALCERNPDLGPTIGLVAHDSVFIGQHKILHAPKKLDITAAVNSLMRNKEVSAVVVACHDYESVRTGWPFDRCDVLIVDAAVANDPNVEDSLLKLADSARKLSPRMMVEYQSENPAEDQQVAQAFGPAPDPGLLGLDLLTEELSALLFGSLNV